MTEAPRPAGIHHLKLPVSDLERSRAWNESRLGYAQQIEFVGQGTLMGGEEHAGVHQASAGWILPLLHDPDGHEVPFYTQEHHTDGVATIHDARETAARRAAEGE
jgi:catechol 2,3-dioxygenase-like lactoylglutathione lyase family enzyme